MHVLKIFWNIHKIKRHFQSYYTFCSFFTFQLFASVPTNPPTFNNLISKRDITYNYNKKERIFFSETFPLRSLFIIDYIYICRVDNPSPTRKFPTINEIIDKFTIHEHLPQAFLFRIENTNALFFFFSFFVVLLLFLFIISFIGHAPPRFRAHISSRWHDKCAQPVSRND